MEGWGWGQLSCCACACRTSEMLEAVQNVSDTGSWLTAAVEVRAVGKVGSGRRGATDVQSRCRAPACYGGAPPGHHLAARWQHVDATVWHLPGDMRDPFQPTTTQPNTSCSTPRTTPALLLYCSIHTHHYPSHTATAGHGRLHWCYAIQGRCLRRSGGLRATVFLLSRGGALHAGGAVVAAVGDVFISLHHLRSSPPLPAAQGAALPLAGCGVVLGAATALANAPIERAGKPPSQASQPANLTRPAPPVPCRQGYGTMLAAAGGWEAMRGERLCAKPGTPQMKGLEREYGIETVWVDTTVEACAMAAEGINCTAFAFDSGEAELVPS